MVSAYASLRSSLNSKQANDFVSRCSRVQGFPGSYRRQQAMRLSRRAIVASTPWQSRNHLGMLAGAMIYLVIFSNVLAMHHDEQTFETGWARI